MQKSRKRTRRLAISAILSALGVVILYLGAIVEVLDLSVAVIASFLCVLAVLEMGGVYPWLIYAVISILSLVLLPLKTASVVFVVFAGYYPIVKAYYERLGTILSFTVKLVHFNVALTVLLLVSKLFVPDFSEMGPLLYAASYALGNLFFILYDIALTRVISLYLRRLRDRLRIKGW